MSGSVSGAHDFQVSRSGAACLLVYLLLGIVQYETIGWNCKHSYGPTHVF